MASYSRAAFFIIFQSTTHLCFYSEHVITCLLFVTHLRFLRFGDTTHREMVLYIWSRNESDIATNLSHTGTLEYNLVKREFKPLITVNTIQDALFMSLSLLGSIKRCKCNHYLSFEIHHYCSPARRQKIGSLYLDIFHSCLQELST